MRYKHYQPTIKQCLYCKENFEVGGRGRPRLAQAYCNARCRSFGVIKHPTLKELSEQEAPYIAGLFDGEGSIILYDRGYGGRKQLRCSVSNTDQQVMDWLLKTTGTGTIVRHVHPKEKNYKDSLTWQTYGHNAVSFLKQLLPFLIIKRDKAINAIESQKI